MQIFCLPALISVGCVIGVCKSHFTLQVDTTVTIRIGHVEALAFRDVIGRFGGQTHRVGRGTPIPKRLVPGMLLSSIVGALFVRLVIRLVIGVEFLVQVAVARLVIKYGAHQILRDQLGIVHTRFGIKPLIRFRGLIHPELYHFWTSHLLGPPSYHSI